MDMTKRPDGRTLAQLGSALALLLSLSAPAAFAEEEPWPLTGEKISFHRRGEPPQLDAAKLFGLPVAQTLAALKSPLEYFHVTSEFGWRGKQTAKRRKFHYGVDYGAPRGTPVHATQNGVVEILGKKKGFGNYIRIRHDNGVETGYAHLTQFRPGLSVGSEVSLGDVLGFVGATGRATGPHLHYEVMVDGVPVNPQQTELITHVAAQ